MNDASSDDARDSAEKRADEIAEHYAEALRAGTAPDAQGIFAANPDIAAILEGTLGLVDLIHDATRTSANHLAPRPATGPEVPSQIGHYIIHEILGVGAFATVYRACDPALGRDVALKVLHDAGSVDAKALARFQREARTATQLRHPHIVHLYEAGAIAGRPYLSMQLIEGESLKTRLGREPFACRAAADFVRKIAGALECVHNLGIVHRDVKPSNILLHPGTDGMAEPMLARSRPAQRCL